MRKVVGRRAGYGRSSVTASSTFITIPCHVFFDFGNDAPFHTLARLFGTSGDLVEGFVQRQIVSY